MNSLQSVLYEIKACDLDSPYIFISYSSLDSELVWQDVREFQRRGYNVWLDEKNLDKTKPSWREDAIAAIEDMECELVVFYVSANSLRSDACYQELSKTVDERTRAMHFGPVKFIAVDAEPVGDITAFAQKVFRDIRESNLEKGERSRQALALDGFMRDFFNSNNEKVRIHPKNEVNRKIDYYDDITASFPDAARVFEPEMDEKPEIEAVTEMRADVKLPSEPEQSTAESMPPYVEEMYSQMQAVNDLFDMVAGTVKSEKAGETQEEEPISAEDWEMKGEPIPAERGETIEENLTPAEGREAMEENPIPAERSETEFIEDAEELPEMTELNPEEQPADDETWFTKNEGTAPVIRKRMTFGKKEMKSTPIRGGLLEIPAGYTEIQIKLSRSLYWGNREIRNLILPDSLRELNIGEFQNCVNLEQVLLPKYLQKIASEAFRGCSSLKEIVIPGNVTTMNHAAFQDCVSLERVVFPE
ncbi:MAG: leucine-rich repeat protein [Lachnospiraceae bacterium]|nr:leucine-rich repeat protein [Lachnospiraceae bacterium]